MFRNAENQLNVHQWKRTTRQMYIIKMLHAKPKTATNIVKNCKLSGKQCHSTRTERRTTLLCRYVMVCQEKESSNSLFNHNNTTVLWTISFMHGA